MNGADADRRSQWLRGVLDLCVLGLLTEGESYGYEIAQAFEKAGLGEIQGGTLYPALTRLQRAELVETSWRDGRSGPARKYYALTEKGRAELRAGGAAWSAFTARVNDVIKGGEAS